MHNWAMQNVQIRRWISVKQFETLRAIVGTKLDINKNWKSKYSYIIKPNMY